MNGSVKTPSYAPGPAPSAPEATQAYLAAELQKISAALRLLAEGHVDVSYRAPEKPRDGDIRLADGAHWDPGAGQGVYAWYAGGWNKLG